MVANNSRAGAPAQVGVRQLLRGLPVLKGAAPQFDTSAAPDDPADLFVEWLSTAIESGVTEPHAMTLSTVTAEGSPSARVLILKDLDSAGWHFAVQGESRKGRELAARPVASLTFYWPQLVRQVRVSGPVVADGRDIAEADFLARPIGSRVMALTGRQSRPMADPGELDDALDVAALALAGSPGHVPAQWISYALQATEVEFWQGDPERRHHRLVYRLADGAWSRKRLWP
ncbi:pyridoxal 5'-phosphate synthase [Nocardia sp. NPDC057668]|uniref:pyridoxine/pyridoxamine 5'-phosphate oxidase n=1 Tax=Nocardia sp. NPDC057668 TaxID=3346202 RepID=UPI00366F1904